MKTGYTRKGVGKLPPQYFDRKLISTGTTRVIAVNGIIPENWENVRIVPKKKYVYKIVVELHRLSKVVETAPTAPTNKNGEQNT